MAGAPRQLLDSAVLSDVVQPAQPAQAAAAMHAKHRFMWARTVDGTSFGVVVTTLKFAHALHSSTRENVSAPLSGFVLRDTLFLDPSGVICEPMTRSTLVQSSADAEFEAAYAPLLHPAGAVPAAASAQACIVSGRVLLGVTAAGASKLSWNLLQDALVLNAALNRKGRVIRAGGPLRKASAEDVPETAIAAASSDARLRGATARELGKAPVAQSAGARRMLIIRVVWSDENASRTMDDAWYLAYASNFVSFANNRSYGNMVVVPTYTTGCVYKLPSHTAAEGNLPANGNSVSGWIFDDMSNAIALASPGCAYFGERLRPHLRHHPLRSHGRMGGHRLPARQPVHRPGGCGGGW